MTDDKYFLGLKLVNGHQQTPHNGSEGLGDDSTRIFDNFSVAIAQIHSFRQELDQSCIHTSYDGNLLIRKFVRNICFIFFVGYKFLVMLQNGFNLAQGVTSFLYS
ncbi:hypothetical protein D3C77_422360 [compost metagenome]